MSSLKVPPKSYRKVLAYGLHRAIKDDCLDEYLAYNDVSDVLNTKIDQTSILGLASMKQNDKTVATLLTIGALPINISYDRYDAETTDLNAILNNCSRKTYEGAVDSLMEGNISSDILSKILVSMFKKVHKPNQHYGCQYYLTKLVSLGRLYDVLHIDGSELCAIAYELYKSKHRTIGFRILFEYGISINKLINSWQTLKNLLDADPELNRIYESYQIPIKEPHTD